MNILCILNIQVAKQVRTVPVRGFGAEERFDAEECDLEDCAPPPPQSHAWKIIQNISKTSARKGHEASKTTSNAFFENGKMEPGRAQRVIFEKNAKFRWSWVPVGPRLERF